MKHFLIIAPISNLYPSGISLFVRVLCSHLSSVAEQVFLVMDKSTSGLPLFQSATESYTTSKGKLIVEWFPSDYFTQSQRHCLTYKIEEIINTKNIDIIISIGVYRSGFCSTVAAKLCGIKHFSVILHEDVFRYHLANAEGLDIAIKNSENHACFNSLVSEHLSIFYGSDITCLTFDNSELLLEINTESNDADRKFISKLVKDKKVILSTGVLDESSHLNEILNRALEYINQNYQWIHAGIISQKFLQKLVARLTVIGYDESFNTIGVISRARFLYLLSQSSTVLIPEGARDTRIIEKEAEILGISVDLPSSFRDEKILGKIQIADWIKGGL